MKFFPENNASIVDGQAELQTQQMLQEQQLQQLQQLQQQQLQQQQLQQQNQLYEGVGETGRPVL